MQTRKAKREDSLHTLQYVTDVLVAILHDVFNTLPLYRYADFALDLATLKRRLSSEGIGFATSVLPNLSQGLFDLLEGRPASFTGFKLRDGMPVFMRQVFLNALDPSRDCRARYVAAIYQVAVAFKKLKHSCGYKKSKLREQYEQFCSTDDELRNIDWFSEDLQPVLHRARFLCKQFAEGIDVNSREFVPRPGPGATNTPTHPWDRYEPTTRFTQIDNVMPYDAWFYPVPYDVVHQARNYLALNCKVEPTSRFKFVPKTYGKARGICIEENEVQFMQQAVRRGLTHHIEKHPLYGRRITLNDQSNNQKLALESSKTKRFATIDMSDASDRVARELVSWLFQDNQDLHDVLMALSTRLITPPRESNRRSALRTAKYAPMGSGLCFPVMSLVHMFLIRAMIQLSDAQYPHWLSTQVWVYGDDIVIPSQCFRTVCDVLPKFGMKINETKSFVTSQFRESCGVHAFDGVDVTPVFCRVIPQKNSTAKTRSIIETEFLFWNRGWFETARMLRYWGSRTEKRLSRKGFVPPGKGLLGFMRPETSHLDHLDYVPGRKVRFNAALHRFERKVLVFHSQRISASILNSTAAYMRYICLGAPDVALLHDGSMETYCDDGARVCHTSDRELTLKLRHAWRPLSDVIIHT